MTNSSQCEMIIQLIYKSIRHNERWKANYFINSDTGGRVNSWLGVHKVGAINRLTEIFSSSRAAHVIKCAAGETF
jgi:hypothetical protein